MDRKKQSKDKASTIAAKAIKDGKAKKKEIQTLAGSVLSQVVTKGKKEVNKSFERD